MIEIVLCFTENSFKILQQCFKFCLKNYPFTQLYQIYELYFKWCVILYVRTLKSCNNIVAFQIFLVQVLQDRVGCLELLLCRLRWSCSPFLQSRWGLTLWFKMWVRHATQHEDLRCGASTWPCQPAAGQCSDVSGFILEEFQLLTI